MSFKEIGPATGETISEHLQRGFDQVQAAVASADTSEHDRLLMIADTADLAHDAYALAMEHLRRENFATAARWFHVAYHHGIAEAQELLAYCDDTPAPAPVAIPADVTLTEARAVATEVVESAMARAEAILTDATARATQLVESATTVLKVKNLDDTILDAEQCRTERRARLLEAALDEFTSKGYAKTTLADLCTRAGISTRTFYTRYASKETLLLELHAHIHRRVMKSMLAMLDSLAHADLITRVTTLIGAFVKALTSDPRYPRLTYIEAPEASKAIERQHQEWFARHTLFIEAEFDRAAKAGLVPQRSYRVTATDLVGAIIGLLRDWRTHEPSTPPTTVANEIQAVTIDTIARCT